MEKNMKENNRTAVLICVKDRPTELSLLLQSLRTQTYQNFDVVILDDCSGTPLSNYHFFNCIMTRMKLEDHNVFIKRTDFPHGVSRARQVIVDYALSKRDYKYLLRVDDDVILESDYIERLFKVINKGYDIASGVTCPMTGPIFKRDPKHLNGIVNRVILDKDGNHIMNGDDCGWAYTESMILPAHHFRSCALIKKEVHEKVKYYPTKFSKHGFREEQIFSYTAQMKGYKIGVDTLAVNYHQMTPSGGERFQDSRDLTVFNQKVFEEFTRKHKDELLKKFNQDNTPSELALLKETNLIMRG